MWRSVFRAAIVAYITVMTLIILFYATWNPPIVTPQSSVPSPDAARGMDSPIAESPMASVEATASNAA